MISDRFLRRALWVSAVYNLGGACLFAFPSSPVAQLVGMPTPVPAVYAGLLGFFILSFGGAYAWLAMQGTIDRALVGFSAIGKAGAFTLIVIFWLVGEGPGRGVVAAIGDIVLAGIFAGWLVTSGRSAPKAPTANRQ